MYVSANSQSLPLPPVSVPFLSFPLLSERLNCFPEQSTSCKWTWTLCVGKLVARHCFLGPEGSAIGLTCCFKENSSWVKQAWSFYNHETFELVTIRSRHSHGPWLVPKRMFLRRTEQGLTSLSFSSFCLAFLGLSLVPLEGKCGPTGVGFPDAHWVACPEFTWGSAAPGGTGVTVLPPPSCSWPLLTYWSSVLTQLCGCMTWLFIATEPLPGLLPAVVTARRQLC